MATRPSPGSMVYWRFRRDVPCEWRFGYCTYEHGHDLIRMGAYNGDTTRGAVVSISEIEWKLYSR